MSDTRPIAIVLPPEFDGATGYLDDIEGGHEFTAKPDTPGSHAVAHLDVRIGAGSPPPQSYSYTYLKVEKEGYRPYRVDGLKVYLGPVQIRIGVPEDPARVAMGLQDSLLLALQPNVQQARYPIVGRVFVKNGAWHDATGPVHLLFHHDMPAVLMDELDPDEADRAADAIARVGSGVRIMVRVSHDNNIPPDPGDYWYGRSISEECRRAHLIPTLQRYAKRGLKVCLTMGSRFPTDQAETAMWLETADMIVAGGLQETIAIAEHRNEPNMTSQYNWDDRAKGWALAKSTMQEFRRRVGCVITGGSWGDNDQIDEASDGMDAMDYHEDRSMPGCIHHIHTAWNDNVFHRSYWKPLWGGERPGPNAPYPENTNSHPHASLGGDMYVGCDDPELGWGVVAQAHFTGQGTAWLNGPGVRHNVALDSTVFWEELPRLVQTYIPRDAGLWRGPNPSWRTPGAFADPDKRFMYAGLAEWDQTGHPPFAIGHWRAIGPTGITDEGVGPIHIAGNWKYRFIVGTRA